MKPFLFGCHISFHSIFALKEVRGHKFWTHLKMCVIIFDLLLFILNNETVNEQFCDMQQIQVILAKKLVEGELWAEVTRHNLGSYESVTSYVQSHMRPFLFWYYISFCSIFAVEEVRGLEFWTHLKMCALIFDLLSLTLNNGTVNGEIRS